MKQLTLTLLLITASLTGCVTKAEFTPYLGQQQPWPTEPGAFAKNYKGTAVYSTIPERPYTVVGSVDMTGAQLANMQAGAARAVRRHGGDAALILEKHSSFAGMIHNSDTTTQGTVNATAVNNQIRGSYTSTSQTTGFSAPVMRQHMTIWIIRWK
jgi:hypothetical protein